MVNLYVVRIGLEELVVVCVSIMGILNKGVGVVVLIVFIVLIFSDFKGFVGKEFS